jgi:biopolymer transport protein ExbD
MNVGSSGGDEDGEVMVDINTTPLIDVMLVLLIMFIITIPIQTHAVKMNMPIPNNNAPPPKPPVIIRIDVDFDGTIGWTSPEGTEVIAAGDRNAIESHLRVIASIADQPEVHLRPNKLVTYKHVALIMATAQRLGVTKIGIVGNEQFL